MKQLLLLRHAKSSWAEAGLGDHSRPLNARGISDTGKMFKRFLNHGFMPDLVISSDAKRARDTASRLREALGLSTDALLLEPALYLAGPSGILDVISRTDDSISGLAVVGHNPGFTDVAGLLARGLRLDNLPTCGMLGVSLEIDHWQDIASQCGEPVYFDFPRNPSTPRLFSSA